MKNTKKILLTSIIATMAAYSTQSVAEAERFKFTNPSALQLKNKKVQITPDLVFELGDYVRQTNFKTRPEFKRIFTSQFQRQFLKKPVKYTEKIESFGDRLEVIRTLTLDTKDPCASGLSGKKMSLCFKPTGKNMKPGVKAEVAKMRRKIAARLNRSNASEKPQLLKLSQMTDEQLLDYVLNKQTTQKVITHTSIVPFVAYKKGKIPKIDLFKPNLVIPKANTINSLVLPVRFNNMTLATPLIAGRVDRLNLPIGDLRPRPPTGPFRFDVTHHQKFKTILGATYGRTYGDRFEVQFARSTWLTDRYYASFTYNIEAGIGLRFPFELDVNARVDKVYSSNANRIVNYPANELCKGVHKAKHANRCAQRATVKIKAKALNANAAFYRNAGIPNSKVFRGKEFVFTIGASCKLYASIPGPNISKKCPSSLRGLDFSRDFRPQLGGNRPVDILSYIAPGRPLGLAIDAGIGYAAINPGVALQAVNGKVMLDLEGKKARISTRNLALDSREKSFTVSEGVNRGRKTWGIKLKNPKYKVGVRVVPRLEVEVGVDLGIYDWNRKFGPYDIDAVAINLGNYSFNRHEGTSNSWNMSIDTRLEQ